MRSRAAHTLRRRAGFTLVEILASLLFLAITVPAIVGALGIASRTSEVAERGSIAGNLAENKLNEMLTDNTWQNAAQANGDCGAGFSNYRWQMTTQTWAGGSTTGNGGIGTPGTSTLGTGTTSSSGMTAGSTSTLTELTVEVFYPVQGSERSVRLTTVVNPAIAAATPTPTPSTAQ